MRIYNVFKRTVLFLHCDDNEINVVFNGKISNHNSQERICYEVYNEYNSTVTGNIYLDAILRLKIKQYEAININLEILVSKDIAMEGKDIVSLVSNIIDNACEELSKIDDEELTLIIKGDNTRLQILAKNKMRVNHALTTEKDIKLHGFGLKIIHEIVEKYEGSIDINTDEFLTIKILILY